MLRFVEFLGWLGGAAVVYFLVGPYLLEKAPWLYAILALVGVALLAFLDARERERKEDAEFRKRWPK